MSILKQSKKHVLMLTYYNQLFVYYKIITKVINYMQSVLQQVFQSHWQKYSTHLCAHNILHMHHFKLRICKKEIKINTLECGIQFS